MLYMIGGIVMTIILMTLAFRYLAPASWNNKEEQAWYKELTEENKGDY